MCDIKLSIIIPAYNVKSYIEQCLRSILSSKSDKFECIIVNDGSTDETLSVLSKFISDNRVIIFNQENKGVSSARNHGLSKSSGEYIWFFDSDDYIVGSIDVILDEIQKGYSSFDFILKTKDFFDKTNKVISSIEKYENLDNTSLSLYLYGGLRYVLWNKIVRRDIIQLSKASFPDGRIMEEIPFFTDYFLYSDRKFKLLDCTVHHRYRENSIITTIKDKNIIDSAYSVNYAINASSLKKNRCTSKVQCNFVYNIYMSRLNEIYNSSVTKKEKYRAISLLNKHMLKVLVSKLFICYNVKKTVKLVLSNCRFLVG